MGSPTMIYKLDFQILWTDLFPSLHSVFMEREAYKLQGEPVYSTSLPLNGLFLYSQLNPGLVNSSFWSHRFGKEVGKEMKYKKIFLTSAPVTGLSEILGFLVFGDFGIIFLEPLQLH